MVPRRLAVAMSAWASRLLSSALSFVNIRLLLGLLGEEKYAAFAVLAGLMNWYALADVGVGAALQNAISEKRAKAGDYRNEVRASAAVVTALLVALVGLAALVSPAAAEVFLGHFALPHAARASAFLLSAAFYLAAAMGAVGYRVWYAEQRGFLANLATALSSVATTALLVALSYRETNVSLSSTVTAALAPAAFVGVLCLAVLAVRRGALEHLPDAALAITLLRRGTPFALFGLTLTAASSLDYLILSQFVDAQSIVTYNLATKPFELLVAMFSSLLTAFWPAWTERTAQGDWPAVAVDVRRALSIGLGIAVACTVLSIPAMPFVLRVLAPKQHLQIAPAFLCLVGLVAALRIWSYTFAVVLQSVSRMRALFVVTVIQATVNAVLQLVLVPRWGIYGTAIAASTAMILTVVWFLPFRVANLARAGTR